MFFFDTWATATVFIDATLTINTSFNILNSNVKFGPNGRILIVAGGNFQSTDSRYFSCNAAWDGIRAEGGALTLKTNRIEDAKVALTIASSTASLIVASNTFNRNVVDIDVPLAVTANALIVGNIFDATSPNFFGLIPEVGVRAGKSAFVTVGLPQTADIKDRNVFRSHRRGASGFRATMNFRYAEFYCNTNFGIFADNGRLDVRGASTFRNLFSRNWIDIRTSQSSLYIYNSDFRDCHTNNIESISNFNAQNIEIKGDNRIETDNTHVVNLKTGIRLDRSSGGSGLTVRNIIEQNQIFINPFDPGHARTAINVRGLPGTSDVMKIWGNYLNMGTGGSIATGNPLNSPLIDVTVNAAQNFNIAFNFVFTNNLDAANMRNRWAFFLHGWQAPSSGNWLSGNQVLGQNASGANYDRGMCAFHFVGCGPWNICDNRADYTLRGFHVSGNCATSVFGGNIIGHHTRSEVPNTPTNETGGLQMEVGSRLGPQICRHNVWQVANYFPDKGAWHKGVASNILESRFDYNPIINGEKPNPITSVTAWFFPNCTEEPSGGHCGEEVPYPTTIDEFERKTIGKNQTYAPPATPQDWEERKQLLVKLLRYPALKGIHPSVQAFYNAHINTSAGKFAQFDEQLNTTMLIEPAQLADLDALRNQVTYWIGKVDSLDGELAKMPGSIQNATPAFFAYRATLLSQIGQLLPQETALEAQIESVRSVGLGICGQSLSALPQTAAYEANQAFINGLLIKKSQLVEFSASDYNTLRNIAAQCPEVAGLTRERAMDLLPDGDPAIARPDVPNLPGCQGFQNEGEERGAAQEIPMWLSPNPVIDALTVHFGAVFSGSVEVLDLAGKSLGLRQRVEAQQAWPLQVGGLSPGMYLLLARADSGARSTLRFVVSQ
jgi:hypothetical protein